MGPPRRASARILSFPLAAGSTRWRSLSREAFRDRWPTTLAELGAPTRSVPLGDAWEACALLADDRPRRIDDDARERVEDLHGRIDEAMATLDGPGEPRHVRMPLASPRTPEAPVPLATSGEEATWLLLRHEPVRDEILRLRSGTGPEGREPFAQVLVQPDRHYAEASETRVFVHGGRVVASCQRRGDELRPPGGPGWVGEVEAFVASRVAPACHLADFAADVGWSGARRGPELVALRPWGTCEGLRAGSWAGLLRMATA